MEENMENVENYENVENIENVESVAEEASYEEVVESVDVEVGDDTWNGYTEEEVIEKLDTLVESLSLSSSYGTVGDYYNQELGFVVFPNWETYQYFIDIDADGGNWAETTDGHYVPLENVEAYEVYIAPEEEVVVEPTENEIESLEMLQSINGTLSVIKMNNATYHEDITELLEVQKETLEYTQVNSYLLIATCFFVALTCGNNFANSFFERMRG